MSPVRRLVLSHAIALGVLFALIAFIVSALAFNSHGHRIDTAKLPPEAQAILRESEHEPLNDEQWKRLNSVMAQTGGWPGVDANSAMSVRKAWLLFLLLPLGGLLAGRLLQYALPPSTILLMAAPSLALLLWAFLHPLLLLAR